MRRNKQIVKNIVAVASLAVGLASVSILVSGRTRTKYTTEAVKPWNTMTGVVSRVLDGDTFDMRHGGLIVRVRVAAIDAPEKNQPFGIEAKKYAEKLSLERTVTVLWKDYDKRYDRYVGYVNCPGNKDLGEELLMAGLAWHYRTYSKDARLQGIEDDARKSRRGIWKNGKSAVAPWDWRNGNKSPFFK